MPKKVRMSLTISEELWQQLSHLAIDQSKTKNALITEMIEKYLAAKKQEKASE